MLHRGFPAERFPDVYRGDILANLDPRATWDTLHQLADGAEPELLCWEIRREDCHRSLVAAWFEKTLGEVVDEWEAR